MNQSNSSEHRHSQRILSINLLFDKDDNSNAKKEAKEKKRIIFTTLTKSNYSFTMFWRILLLKSSKRIDFYAKNHKATW